MKPSEIWARFLPFFAGVLLLAGCGENESGSLADRVPADAVVVKSVDLDALLKSAGCGNPFDTQGQLRENAEKVISLTVAPDLREALTELLRIENGVAAENMIVFTTAKGYEMAVMPLLSRDKTVASLDAVAGGSLMSQGEYAWISAGGCDVVVEDHFCWLAPDVEAVKEVKEKSSTRKFASMVGVDGFLSPDGNQMKIAVNCGRSMLSFLGGDDRWLGIAFRVTDASVSATGVLMDEDGRQYPFGDDFEEIDTDFLRYTPNDAAVVLAFGKFSGNVRGLSFLLGRFAPVYLADADGTTSLYAVPAGSSRAVASHEAGAWNVETMVHVPEAVLESGLRQYIDGCEGRASEIGGQWTYTDGDARYYFGAFDGCLVFSSGREISAGYNNEFNEDFAGKRAAMVVSVPANSVLSSAWGLPYGFTLKIGVERFNWKARIVFNGSDLNAFESLLALPQLADFHERFVAATGQ